MRRFFAALLIIGATVLAACGGGGSSGAGGSIPGGPTPPPSANQLLHCTHAPGGTLTPDTNGCDWPEFRRDNQRTGSNPYQTMITPANVATLKVKWHQTTGGVFANAVVANNVVYQADLGGVLHAWNILDGSQLWTYAAPGTHNQFQSTPAFYNNVLYLGDFGTPSQPAKFRAINAQTGQLIWSWGDSWSTGALPSFQGSPLVANGLVYEGQTSQYELPTLCIPKDQLVAFNPATGTLASSLTLTQPGQDGISIWSSPTQDAQGNIFVATANRCDPNAILGSPYADAVLKLANGGAIPLGVQWAFQSQAPLNSALDLDFGATPVAVNGMIVEGGKDGYVYAIRASTGTLIWKQQTGSVIGSPATDGIRVYVPVYNTPNGVDCTAGQNPCGGLFALNLSDGSVAWKYQTAADKYGNGSYSAPAVSNGIVFEAIGNTVYAFAAGSGSVLWKYTASNIIYQGMAVVNGGLLVGEFDGSGYYCFTPNGV